MSPAAHAPRVRQAVLVASDLDAVTGRLRPHLGLGPPFADPAVAHFGLRNAVFALGDTFLEVVSPVATDTSAGRLLSRRGGDGGYMVMIQVADLAGARERARAQGVREVFEVSFEDIAEVHLHPVDMGGAIVSLTTPEPAESWRWGGPGWRERSRPLSLAAVTLTAQDPDGVAGLWGEIIGSPPQDAGIRFIGGPGTGLVEIELESADPGEPVEIGGVRFKFKPAPIG
jgi:Glyoxalase-like domain